MAIRLIQRDEQLARQMRQLLLENKALRGENARLRKELEEWKRGHRERAKRRSSRPEHRKPRERKKSGRKAGHPGAWRPPVTPDRTVEHPMPDRCKCGGCVEATGEVETTVVQDIPQVRAENVEHVAAVGQCLKCGKRVVSRLPGTPATGGSVVATQLGPNAHALVVGLRFDHRMPMGQISEFLRGWFGLSITAGGIHHLLTRTRKRSEASYDELEQRLRSSSVVGIDETGLRQDGVPGWAWLARTDEVSVFRVELSRGAWVAEAILGSDFKGVVCSDFYGVYTAKTEWAHGYCGAHAIREAKKIAEVSPSLWTEMFRDQLCNWYDQAKLAQKNGSRAQRDQLKEQLDAIVTQPVSSHPDVLRLAARIRQHFDGVVYFIDHRSVPSDNNATERDIRPVTAFRKITGGTHSESGSKNAAHWLSISQTRRKNQLPLRDFVYDLWCSHQQGRPPPSVFQ